jgi:uncharacterized repeat protein (TIGR03847 family)
MTEPRLVDSCIPGFVGEPGYRTFYLQVDAAGSRSWYLVEKGQVAALAVDAGRILVDHDLEGAGDDFEVGELAEPDEVAFRVSELELAYDEGTGIVAVTLVSIDEADVPVTHLISTAQLRAAARVAAVAVMAGRPRCPRCGLAMDPDGHPCPLGNGDLRGHRP